MTPETEYEFCVPMPPSLRSPTGPPAAARRSSFVYGASPGPNVDRTQNTSDALAVTPSTSARESWSTQSQSPPYFGERTSPRQLME